MCSPAKSPDDGIPDWAKNAEVRATTGTMYVNSACVPPPNTPCEAATVKLHHAQDTPVRTLHWLAKVESNPTPAERGLRLGGKDFLLFRAGGCYTVSPCGLSLAACAALRCRRRQGEWVGREGPGGNRIVFRHGWGTHYFLEARPLLAMAPIVAWSFTASAEPASAAGASSLAAAAD